MAPPDGTITAATVRDLLTAITAVLDIPSARYCDQEVIRTQALDHRARTVAMLCRDRCGGPLDDLYLKAMCDVLGMWAVQPLRYQAVEPR